MKKQDATLSQSERFKQAARELGCDDDPERFKETVRKLAKAPPAPGPTKAGKVKGGGRPYPTGDDHERVAMAPQLGSTEAEERPNGRRFTATPRCKGCERCAGRRVGGSDDAGLWPLRGGLQDR